MIYQFTHTDLDGVGCASILKFAKTVGENKFVNDEIHVEYCDYNNIDETIKKTLSDINDKPAVLISDISVTDETAEYLDTLYKENKIRNLYLLDHHPTAERLSKYDWARIKTSKEYCGTVLTAELLFTLPCLQSLQTYIEAVCQYDTWTYDKDTMCLPKQLNYLCYMMDHDSFIDFIISRLLNNPLGDFRLNSPMLEKIIDFKEQQANEYADSKAKSAQIITAEGHKVAVVYAESNISIVGNKTAEYYKDQIDYVAIIDLSLNKVSLRGIHDYIDLGKDIAKPHGGGGHAKAAGYNLTMPDETMIKHMLNMEDKNDTVQTDTESV